MSSSLVGYFLETEQWKFGDTHDMEVNMRYKESAPRPFNVQGHSNFIRKLILELVTLTIFCHIEIKSGLVKLIAPGI